MSEPINTRRRRLIQTTVAGLGLMELTMSGLAHAQASIAKAGAAASHPLATFDEIKQISVGPLNIGYVDAGPRNGPVALLVHGWPYDI